MKVAKPFVKWAGGKSKLVLELLNYVPEKIDTYVEPFIGGGALFFELARQKRFKHAILCDSNEELMNAYVCVWRSLPALIVHLESHKYDPQHYYEVRAQDPKNLSSVARAARFIFLNKTCFNGLYRVNKKGQFNVPFGRYANPTICDTDNLRAVSELLRSIDVEFWVNDFSSAIGVGDFCYCDPPYDVVSDTSDFTSYSKEGFGWADQERLERAASAIDPGKIVLSNADTPRIRELYKGWNLHEVKVDRAINSKADKRGKVGELIIVGKR